VLWTGQPGFITVLALDGSAEAGALTSQVKITAAKLALNSRIQNLSAANISARSRFHSSGGTFLRFPPWQVRIDHEPSTVIEACTNFSLWPVWF
jgi:hypothetical protein